MKFFRNKLAVTVLVLSVGFLALIFYSAKTDKANAVQSGASATLNPAQSIIYKINNRIKETLDFFLNFSEVKSQNKELVKENEELKNQILENSDVVNENERLREILNFTNEKDNYNYVACDIIGFSNGNFVNGYIINKGAKDNIKKGMVVIAAKGLVGQVTSVSNSSSIVQSIMNENIAVSVMVDSTREATGYLKGYKDRDNSNLAKVYELPVDSEIKEGDVIMTSGVGGIYPKEIKIGEVEKVEEDNTKVTKTAIVKPYVDFNKLEELVVVCPKDTSDISYN
ncbi:rod shape-determining protein MreC [Clostridium sp. BJN0001]|uniref:rod shape-determining protein MreC n=1 Tax=Clostridium sp. BJN0001 TaxID=2930219 RepID=UPI001FD072D5|nr:rod shape-determining protein MreC [Clostridium sp. BJN0001]